VIRERPVKNIIEKPYYVDEYVEVPVTKEIIKEKEVIKELKKVNTIEKEVIVPKYVEKPYDVVVEKPVEKVSKI